MSKNKDHSWIGLIIGLIGIIGILTVLHCETKAQVSLSTQADMKLDTDTCTGTTKNRDIRVRVGDEKEASFKPELNMSAWGGECSINIGLMHNATDMVNSAEKSVRNLFPSVTFVTDNNDTNKIYRREDGCLEWELVLSEQPKSGIFSFPIETEGLKFLYQDPLLIPNQHDSIKGSYAVYHETRRNNHRHINIRDSIYYIPIIDSLNELHTIDTINGIVSDTTYEAYKTGKAFHIYRPKIVDDNMSAVWGDINITADSLYIIVPSEFLKNATYPIIIDPTMGFTTAGGSNETMGEDDIFFNFLPFDTVDAAGSLDSAYMYSARGFVTDLCTIQVAVYTKEASVNNCDSVAVANIAYVDAVVSISPAWIDAAFPAGDSVEADGTYICGQCSNRDDADSDCYHYYDTDGAWSSRYENYATDWPWPANLTGYNVQGGRQYSMYVVYTTEVAEAQSVRRRKMLLGGAR
jgi:hypothetical protein